MKSQVLRIKSTIVARQLLPLRLNAPCTVRLQRPRTASSPLEGLESAPGTLPASLLNFIR